MINRILVFVFLSLSFLSAFAGQTDLAPHPVIIEVQFEIKDKPLFFFNQTAKRPNLKPHPLQAQLRETWKQKGYTGAFFPDLGPEIPLHAIASGDQLARLIMDHGLNVFEAYRAGRERFAEPFLLNVSRETPQVLQELINLGVRIVSWSLGFERDTDTSAYEKVIRENPEVIFVVSVPHFTNLSPYPRAASVEEIDEFPSRLAGKVPNVILAGCLDRWNKDFPYKIDNQSSSAPQKIFMFNCDSSDEVSPGFGGTSAAAPHLASLFSLAVEHQIKQKRATTREALLAMVHSVLHKATAIEQDQTEEEVEFFTLDTVLLNMERPLIGERLWLGIPDYPAPLKFQAR